MRPCLTEPVKAFPFEVPAKTTFAGTPGRLKRRWAPFLLTGTFWSEE
jgi:hypothetical protein